MKNLFLIAALGFSSLVSGQVEEPGHHSVPPVDEVTGSNDTIKKDDSFVYDVVDEIPKFPGGREALSSFLQSNFIYPQIALKNKIDGKCYVKFTISKEGKVSNVRLLKGMPECPECDAESLRVIRIMPNWIPGKVDGQPVNSNFTLPISFHN